jgi:hypothetical protein
MDERDERSRRIGRWGERASWQFGTDRLGQANRVWVWIGVTEDRPQSWRRPPEIDSNRIISMVDQYKDSLDGRIQPKIRHSTSTFELPGTRDSVRYIRTNSKFSQWVDLTSHSKPQDLPATILSDLVDCIHENPYPALDTPLRQPKRKTRP